VIHLDDNGSPGDVIGHAPVATGANQNVRVVLDEPARNGDTLWAMLHDDTGTPGEYEFPAADPPVQAGGAVVMDSFVVTVPAGTPAARITLAAQGTEDYVIQTIEPDGVGIATEGAQDPELALRQGWRYEVVNTVAVAHPFELLDMGATAAEDVVLLSQTADGSMEGTASIAWTEDGDTVTFTVSPELNAELTGYRCGLHPGTMRGAITITP
jgi:hypothetical protein